MRRSIRSRVLLAAIAVMGMLPALAAGQSAEMVLAISEGTSGGLDHAQVIAKYGGLAGLLGKAINKRVSMVLVREFSQLEAGMKSARFDLVMARPSDYPARGIRDYQYRYVASASPAGQCLIIVPKGSPIRTLAEAHGHRWVLPEPAAYMTRFCKAELRDRGIRIEKETVRWVREQNSVGAHLENGFGEVGGVASYSGVARTWERSGHRILHSSAPQPYFPLIASPKVSASDVEAIQKLLFALPDSAGGPALLKTLGVTGFDVASKDRLEALLVWLDK